MLMADTQKPVQDMTRDQMTMDQDYIYEEFI